MQRIAKVISDLTNRHHYDQFLVVCTLCVHVLLCQGPGFPGRGLKFEVNIPQAAPLPTLLFYAD